MAIDPLKGYPGYALRRASAATMADLARRLSALNLRPTESTVLMVIDANPNITQSEISRMLDMASANTAPLVSRLEERDLIEREPVDGRSHGLNLTPAGRALAVRARRTVDAHEDALMAKVPTAQRAALRSALRALWSDGD